MDKEVAKNFLVFLRLLQFLLLIYDMKIHKVLPYFLLFFQTCLLAPFFSILKIRKIPPGTTLNQKIKSIGDENCYGKLSKRDIKMVMDRLGISYELDCDKLDDGFGADEVAETFDKEEPSLAEVKEAFDVFDENKDGFIDATELQRVLRCLGVKGRSVQVEECARMIKVADEDDDGRIDFNEFLKFMETCFC